MFFSREMPFCSGPRQVGQSSGSLLGSAAGALPSHETSAAQRMPIRKAGFQLMVENSQGTAGSAACSGRINEFRIRQQGAGSKRVGTSKARSVSEGKQDATNSYPSLTLRVTSIKPFIVRVKFRKHHDQHPHFADGPV